VRRPITELKGGGATRLYDTIGAAARTRSAFPSGVRRAAVIFTDGFDSKANSDQPISTMTAKQAAAAARRAGVPLYFVGLGSKVKPELLGKMASFTGGRALITPKREELAKVFGVVAESLRTSYRFSYVTPKPARDGTIRTLEITSRLSGKDSQGRAKYRAPRPRGDSGGVAAADDPKGRGIRAYRALLNRLATLQAYQVNVSSRVPAMVVDGRSQAALRTAMRLSADTRGPQVQQRVTTRVDVGGKRMGVRVATQGDRSVVTVGGGTGAITVDAGGSYVQLRDPLGSVMPVLSVNGDRQARARQILVAAEKGGGVVEISPGLLEVRGDDGGLVRISYDVSTQLPTQVVTVDSGSGSASTVKFKGWSTEAVTVGALPAVNSTAPGAVRFAGDFAGRVLGAVGATTAVGLQAGALGLELGAAGAAVGVAAPRAERRADGAGRRWQGPRRTAGLDPG
jgi:hypothetical protein